MCLLVYGAGLTVVNAGPEINNRTGGASIAPGTATTITYLTERKWDPKTLPYGKAGSPRWHFARCRWR